MAKAKKKKSTRKRKPVMWRGNEIDRNADKTLVCERYVHLSAAGDATGKISYRCRFKDGSWRVVPEDDIKKYIK